MSYQKACYALHYLLDNIQAKFLFSGMSLYLGDWFESHFVENTEDD